MQDILFHSNRTKVFVYRNLHQDCWSVKALEGIHKGRVIVHARYVSVVEPIEFRVSEAGRQRVLREKRKNVHAGVVGRLMFAGDVDIRYPIETEIKVDNPNEDYSINLDNPAYRKVTYNPYKFDKFVFSDDLSAAVAVDDEVVILDGNGKVVVLNPQRLHQVVTDQYLARRA